MLNLRVIIRHWLFIEKVIYEKLRMIVLLTLSPSIFAKDFNPDLLVG